ncbi:hypothetical protein A0H81_11441 [Grifola frondosa]|uniref:Uncharacterized protein n=1 Tax=Grifola frondosa TaxID=5627 RepID=A0A1C7LW76_GRIFR|nr:hypothetical protein A0H81_11441 [Grifola frondosa]
MVVLALSLFNFPSDCVHSLNYPMSNMNLYVTRLDITFDRFRIRDAELLRQSISLIREKSITSKVDWGGVFFDTLADIFACTR